MRWISLAQNQHLKRMFKSADLRAIRSEGPSWAGICWVTYSSRVLRVWPSGSHCAGLTEPEGQDSRSHTFFTCQKLALILRQVYLK